MYRLQHHFHQRDNGPSWPRPRSDDADSDSDSDNSSYSTCSDADSNGHSSQHSDDAEDEDYDSVLQSMTTLPTILLLPSVAILSILLNIAQ